VLQEKLDYSIPKNPVGAQEAAVKAILDAIGRAEHPIILLDRCATRNDVKSKVSDFVIASGFPVYSKPNGLGVINHCVPNYRGCYIGASSLTKIRQEVLDADLVLEIGSEALDINTGGFTLNLDTEKVISFDTSYTKVFHSMFENVAIQELLPVITKRFPASCKVDTQKLIESQLGPRALQTYTTDNDNKILEQAYFWSKLASYLPEKVTLVIETGTPTLGTFNLNLPKDCTLIRQLGWASIGYGIPATLGAAIADRSRPVILLVGDGSFQVSVQEVSLMLYHGVCPIIILFNNDGYLIEKLVHGEGHKYNDIQMWEYAETFRYFGRDIPVNQDRAIGNAVKVGVQKRIHTSSEFDTAMAQAVSQSDRIHFLELVFPSDDVPKSVLTFVSSYKQ
jgi:pyruvate decarboxylase